jgi:hypothetical protein
VATAVPPTSAFFGAVAGVRVPSVLSLGGLVETLLVPTVERDPFGAAVPQPDLMDAEPDRFSEEHWQRAGDLLQLPEVGRRLSGLLAEARTVDPELPGLVLLRVMHAVGSTISSARGQDDGGVCLAIHDGTVLADEEFGGSDLLVTLAGLRTAAVEETDPAPAATEDVA